ARELAITTNFHCFAATGKSGEISSEFLPEACKNTRIYFGFTKESASKAKEFHCLEGSLAGDNAGDIAILTITEDYPENVRALEIWEDPNVPADRDVLILHHP